MNVIAIETSGKIGSVAAARDDKVLLERSFEKGMRHGRDLLPALRETALAAGWKPSEIHLVAVSIGPGSYTGLRIGVACAKTIAYATGAETIAVPTLDVLAENAPPDFETVCPVLDAKRGQVYAAVYRRLSPLPFGEGTGGEGAATSLSRRTDDLLIAPADLVHRLSKDLPRPAFLLGDGLATYRKKFTADGLAHAEERLWIARASVVARLGFAAFKSGRRDPWQTLTPRYLRRPEAEEVWEKKKERRSAQQPRS
jgi:tRNA threonylcarbamoyladenosine biosynthesis protein TsaB